MSFVLTTALERSANAPAGAFEMRPRSALDHLREGCFQRSLCLLLRPPAWPAALKLVMSTTKGATAIP